MSNKLNNKFNLEVLNEFTKEDVESFGERADAFGMDSLTEDEQYALDNYDSYQKELADLAKRKEHIKANYDKKREAMGINNPAITYSMGGSPKGHYAKDAGIKVIHYDADKNIAKLLRSQQKDMTQFMGDLIGSEQTPNQAIYVGKEVVNDNGKAAVAVLYNDFASENEGEVEAAITNVIEQAITNPSDGSPSVSESDFSIEETTYRANESQVRNAKERYSENGTWVGKNVNKPIKLDVSLDETLVSEVEASNEKQMGE